MKPQRSALIPNAYWIEPGKLLGGAYPATASCAVTLERIGVLLAAGVTSFVDLTEEGECVPYHMLLPPDKGLNGAEVRYVRKPLGDHQIPRTPEVMRGILDYMASSLAEGHRIYLHCRAGIGRTGTVAGCHLIERGMAPAQALEHLQRLWEEGGRTSVWPHTPETEDQTAYVRNWGRLRLGHSAAPWWQPWKRASKG